MNIILNDSNILVNKIICVGRNYYDHIEELGNKVPTELVLFNKSSDTISKELLVPKQSCRFEAEICFLVKNQKIIAIGFGLDLTLVDVQNRLKSNSLPWEKAKSFANSALFSDFVLLNEYQTLSMQLYINNELIQEATLDLMIHKPQQIIDEIKNSLTLSDNDIIMSGTPKGVGFLFPNQEFTGIICVDGKEIIKQKWISKNNF